jgi:16S rRNA (cytidine1402-2'-O)-methyltransferase
MMATAATPGGRLFVVATPIGNLGDITRRALDTLRAVDLVAAEDTRLTGRLLKHFDIHVPLLSYQAHNRARRLPQLLDALRAGDVALVTDAGTPLISDPGQELVAAAAGAGHEVIPIPGPSAPIAALSVAGLPALPFHFLGFLPRRSGARRATLQAARGWTGALVLFEAPHRLVALLQDALDVLGDRRVVVCCELTKLYEQVLRITLSGALDHFRVQLPRGEFTLVIAGPETTDTPGGACEPVPEANPAAGDLHYSPEARRRRFEALVAQLGDRRRALAALAAESRLPRKALYAELISGAKPSP